MDFAVPADNRIKLKENKKKDKYLDLAGELKKQEHESDGDTNCNWCLGRVIKELVQGPDDLEIVRVETIQTTALLRSARMLRKVLETGVKNSRSK